MTAQILPLHAENFLSLYLRAIGISESPRIYHRWCAISGIGALLGRQFFLPFGNGVIYPNQYVMLIGSPGTRKNTAVNIMQKFLKSAGYITVAKGKTSKEQFLANLANGAFGKKKGDATKLTEEDYEESLNQAIDSNNSEYVQNETREVYIIAEEFQDFIGNANTEFISLLTNLWDNLDDYDHQVKNSKSSYVHQPTVNILSGNTPTGFAITFPPEVIGQGMLSRLLLIYGEATGVKITFPEPIDPILYNNLTSHLLHIKNQCIGEVKLTNSAKILLDKIYTTWRDIDDARLKSYSGRRFTHLLKLCIISAAFECSKNVTEKHVLLSNTILTEAELHMPNALGEFGKSKHANVSGKILQFLEEKSTPVKSNILWKLVHQDLEKMTDLSNILMNLESAEKIQKTQAGFLIRKTMKVQTEGLIDFKLLEEF